MSDLNPGWRVIDLLGFHGHLGIERGRLRVDTEEPGMEPTLVPLSQIAVVLIGLRCSLSPGVLMKLAEYDAAVLVCDWKGTPVSAVYPWSEHSRVAARQIAQASMSVPRKKRAWAEIVRAKIRGQAHTLRLLEHPDDAKTLEDIARHVRSGDSENAEAHAARLYWAAISGEQRFTRAPQSADSGDANAALNYGYTILRGFAIRSLSAAGLAGTLGVFHRHRDNPFCLADDLMEPFRPYMDAHVFSHPELWDLSSKEAKHHLVSVASGRFADDGSTIPTVIMKFAQHFGRYVEGDESTLSPPLWNATLHE